ncbi:MAG: hypothetical protein CSB13_05305 [Chloroflexi bacterium]|nr:MAG: hypothetical protein CSB13_05305 [Chloroflexota bacterium]
MNRRKFVLLAVIIGLISVMRQTVLAQETFVFEPAECMFPGMKELGLSAEKLGFECGYVTVPEEHANPDGPTIRIPVGILRATGMNPQPDPVFWVQGGPGGDAFDAFSAYLPQSPLRQDRDLVVINQRGTIYAEPDLRCTEIVDGMGEMLGMSLAEGTVYYYDLLQACHQRLETEGVNLSAFDSIENANDIEAVRQALGYDTFNFYGVSYGTLLGLHLMREHPEALRSVILDGVVPTSSNFITSLPENENRVYEELFAACAHDAACAAAYPHLEQRFRAVVDELNTNPITLTLTDPETGEKHEAWVDGAVFVDVMYQLLYFSEAYAMFPKLVANAEDGDFVFLQEVWPLLSFDRTSSYGMYYSVICAEEVDFDPAAISADTYPSFIANGLQDELQSYLDACKIWSVETLPASVNDPVVSDIPVLLMSGRFDPITPPNFADEAAQTLSNSTHIVDPWASHSIALKDECVDGIMQRFLMNPDAPVDVNCLEHKQPVAFVPVETMSVAVLAKINQLDPGIMVQMGVSALLLIAVLFAMPIWLVVWIIQSGKKDQLPLTSGARRVRRTGRLLVIGYGVLGMIYALALTAVLFIPLVETSPMALMLSVPSNTWPVFAAGWLLVLLAIGMVITAVLYWRQSWSVWGKLYYSFLTLCAVSYVAILGVNGLLTIIF